jgi:hypothetical protein
MSEINEAIKFNCKECGARPGEYCITRSGMDIRNPHWYRKQAAEDNIDPGPQESRSETFVRIFKEVMGNE